MAIGVGDLVPSGGLKKLGADGPEDVPADSLFSGKKVVLFAVPGAFTPTCSAKHVPGFLQNLDALRAKGVDTVACVSVNDPFVMAAWAKEQGAEGKIEMLADGAATFTKAMGQDIDLAAPGLGVRSKRYAMIVDDGKVTALEVDDSPGTLEKSSAEAMLAKL